MIEESEDDNKEDVYKFAIASKSSMMVDEHFGHVNEFYFYKYENKEIQFVEKRKVVKYCTDEEDCNIEESKITKTVNTISDCDAVHVLRIGYRPSKVLDESGIDVIQTCGGIHEAAQYAVERLKEKEA